MKLDWMLLTNYAEAPPGTGLVNMMGAGWDTIHVAGPLEGAPPQVVALMQGTLALRILFHQTESLANHGLRIILVDEDGGEAGKIEGEFHGEQPAAGETPMSWPHGINMAFPLTGLPLTKFGLYRISLLVDDQHVGDREFRVVKEY